MPISELSCGSWQPEAALLKLTHIRVLGDYSGDPELKVQPLFLGCVVAPTEVPASGSPSPMILPRAGESWTDIRPIRWMWFKEPGDHLQLYATVQVIAGAAAGTSEEVQFFISRAYIDKAVTVAPGSAASSPAMHTEMRLLLSELSLPFTVEVGYEVNGPVSNPPPEFVRSATRTVASATADERSRLVWPTRFGQRLARTISTLK